MSPVVQLVLIIPPNFNFNYVGILFPLYINPAVTVRVIIYCAVSFRVNHRCNRVEIITVLEGKFAGRDIRCQAGLQRKRGVKGNLSCFDPVPEDRSAVAFSS
jgi:hypothetical protein